MNRLWYNFFYNEMLRIDNLSDKSEMQTQYELLGKINTAVLDYERHVDNYSHLLKKEYLIQQGVEFICQNGATEIKALWDTLFASNVDQAVKKHIYYASYKWHLFSFHVLNALEGTKARQAFNRCKKTAIYTFYQNSDEAFLIKSAQSLRSSYFDRDYDIIASKPKVLRHWKNSYHRNSKRRLPQSGIGILCAKLLVDMIFIYLIPLKNGLISIRMKQNNAGPIFTE